MGMNDSAILAAIDMVSAGILGLAFIALVVFAILASKTWHWVNVVFVILTFIAGVTAIFGLTQVYKLRTDAIANYDKAKADLEKYQAEADLKTFGEITSLSYDPGTLRAVSEELSREMQGRGRVWSNGQVAAENALRVFTFATPRSADEPSLQDVVLFAFRERDIGGELYPERYIGSVRVTQETPESVKLEAVALADGQEFNQPTAPWALFEKMPLDRRGIFRAATLAFLEGKAETTPEQEKVIELLQDPNADELEVITAIRGILTADYLTDTNLGLDPNSPTYRTLVDSGFDPAKEYEELVDRYAFDGLSLGKIQNWIDANRDGRISSRFDPPPEEVFIVYKFDESSSRSYQVDANGSIETDGLFTPLGQAVDPALHAGKEISFAKGDTVLVDQRSADGYQRGEQQVAAFSANEKVTEIDRVYIRQVRDFPFEFADLRAQAAKVVQETDRIEKSNAVQSVALENAKSQQQVRDALIADLDADNMNLKNDLDTINNLFEQKSQATSELKSQIATLEKKIDESYAKLRSLAVTLSKKAFAGK